MQIIKNLGFVKFMPIIDIKKVSLNNFPTNPPLPFIVSQKDSG